MNARILCPGPSLARYEQENDFSGLVVGVNRAAIRFRCDAWAALDPPLVEKIHREILGVPTLVTSVNTPEILARSGIAWPGKIVAHNTLFDFVPFVVNYVLYSATMATVYAASTGATAIDVYGADCAGTLDYDGVEGGTNRTEKRWTQEKHIWAATVTALAQRGVEVRFH